MPILRLNFITKLIFIHLTIQTYNIPGKTYNPTNYIMNKNANAHIFLHIILVTSSSTVDLTPNFSKSNYIDSYYKWYKLCIARTVMLFWESLSRLLIKNHLAQLSSPCQSSVACKLPWWCIRGLVLQNYPSLIF